MIRAKPMTGLRLPLDLSVATSGLRAQSYALGGTEYGHIIDPHLARPVVGGAASVLRASAMEADGWATALAAAGAQGPQIAQWIFFWGFALSCCPSGGLALVCFSGGGR
ncbi:FAD:protein FMN transferase [Pseudorhodobacter turbinis]|uniref:FAD:protein FMN transferase n=1 Tax=Pseudorhodobacter turbinis TaxID=2500533 RepID=A0A4P8EEI4_9RHOB|nr:FAD:protein FMN transferase [Pseudorhodobacter turbinis]